MIALVKATGATLTNGALQLVYQNRQGLLADIFAASFQIWDEDFEEQVYPSSSAQALALTGAGHVGVGRYNAVWDSSAAENTVYNVRWFVTPASGSAEITFDHAFELVNTAYPGPHYCFVQDLRDEGLPLSVTDRQAQTMIVRASRFVEFFTGRTFDPRYGTIEFDGRGSRALLLDEPIIAIESISLNDEPLSDLSILKIYNRHLAQGLLNPDDRDSPKIEFIADETWSRDGLAFWAQGVRNAQLTGLFGYTEPDGSYVGQTPGLIREATKMLVFENSSKLAGGGSTARGPVIRERTRDQQVDFAPLRVTGLTGNRSIDVLLAGFKRPPGLGST